MLNRSRGFWRGSSRAEVVEVVEVIEATSSILLSFPSTTWTTSTTSMTSDLIEQRGQGKQDQPLRHEH